ncbi:C-type natriuretic peptide 1-like [Ahaetulla prasina]|uniref:C-type natriuretic peptide 1-like n=1 Tax=Ahaetulla prasina TaxID=499056 RepID=UPI0026491A26|nr:C-type natriuretic peptide 1-like [Ahaetulla prasina]
MEARPLLLFLCLLLPASQSPVHSPQLLLEILGPDLAILLSGHEALGSSPPPSGGPFPPRPPTLPPGHPWLHLLRELAKSQARKLRGRFRKGAQLGCFGIKLDRIGTFSGLGC